MKALKLLLAAFAFFTISATQAQVQVNVNLGSPPAWGPAGYTNVRYYYLPDIHTYYDVSNSQYIYLTNGKWMRVKTLPAPYRSYNLYNGYKVVMTDYRGSTPYVYYNTHKVKYPKGYKGKPQKTIGVPPGHAKKMVGAKSASTHKVSVKSKGNGNGGGKAKGNGGGKGNGKGKN